MIKIVFSLIILMLIPNVIKGQTLAIHSSDYIVTLDGDTLYGTLEYIDYRSPTPKIHKKFRITDFDGKTIKVNANKINSFKYNGYFYESFILSDEESSGWLLADTYLIDQRKGERFFLKLITKGNLSHYEMESWEQGNSRMFVYDLFIKEHENYFTRATIGLLGLRRKRMASYFNDCPVLSAKIIQKELSELSEVVNFYNSECE